MLGKEIMLTLYEYNHWANQRILAAAEKLAPGQWEAPNQVTARNLRAILFHLVRTEYVWRELAKNRGQLSTPPQPEDLDTLELIKNFEDEQACQAQAYLNNLTEEDLLVELELQDRSGKKSTKKIWQMLVQPVMHSMQHRSEAAAILTSLGQSPGDIDFAFFV